MAKDARSDEETPLNPWKTTDARQISEQVSGFVKRLPPPSPITPPSDRSPWYWIAHPNRSAYVDDRADLGDVVSFVCEGRALLEEYEQRRSQVVTERHLDETPGQSQQLRDAIWEAARKWKVVCGKMLSPKLSKVDEVWRAVCKAVVANRLGTGAKVATSSEKRRNPIRLIYIYTKDFANMEDIKRVLLALVEAGLAPHDHAPAVRYKCDAYTYLKIYAKNKYGL